MSDMEERFSNSLQSTARAWRLAVDRRLKHLGMSQASCMTFAVAAQAATPLSQSELADRLAVEGATVVSMIDRLVKAGLVLREPSTVDRRIKRIVVTVAGRQLFARCEAEAADVRGRLLAHVSPEQLAAATEMLEVLNGMFGSLA